ncbi:hypothetical protein DES53_10620 [Roseimicrobium gellanilyticum]|uniref:Uncharacterized protein n=2 Tax=Roseimicrobium gellanilyticum TaxID=748857 RepID=A0A366HHT3_9BACT|nr:hypothetical protein DES53_10620 [Roseimicrobium gellanilyticum]
MPVVFVIVFLTVAGTIKVVAGMKGVSAQQILKTDTLWPLWIMFPSFVMGVFLGLIGMNLLARLTPLGRVFDRECAQTGRHGFAQATLQLTWGALGALLLTALSCAIYLCLAPL